MKTHLLDDNCHPGPRWLVLNFHPAETENDYHGNERIISKDRRPSYMHETREDAEKEALRLAQLYGGHHRTFIVFEAVAFTEMRTPFEIAETVIVLEPIARKVVEIPDKPRRQGRRNLINPLGLPRAARRLDVTT